MEPKIEFERSLLQLLAKIESKLEKENSSEAKPVDFSACDAFVWQPENQTFLAVQRIKAVPFKLLLGIEQQKKLVLQNTLQFARGYAANNVLLWGARGMGKSSLVKAAHSEIMENEKSAELKLIEINREDISSLPDCLRLLQGQSARFILYCDDLSFDGEDTSYKSLKAVLEGGLEGRPENVLFYATSNRRHLMPRDMIENESGSALHPSEAAEEKISLSDRFGLWIGFHNCSQAIYLEIVEAYAKDLGLKITKKELHAGAIEWSATRGSRSGRVAWQFIQDLSGRLATG